MRAGAFQSAGLPNCGGAQAGGGVGAVNFDELVVEAEDQKRRGPLADEERHVLFSRGFEANGDGHRGEGRT
jgi:hypothetical protein